jgi:hypothetical protein
MVMKALQNNALQNGNCQNKQELEQIFVEVKDKWVANTDIDNNNVNNEDPIEKMVSL